MVGEIFGRIYWEDDHGQINWGEDCGEDCGEDTGEDCGEDILGILRAVDWGLGSRERCGGWGGGPGVEKSARSGGGGN